MTHYEYTLDNRLKRVYRDDGSLDVQYGYDPFGRRLWKEIDGARTYYLYAEEGLIAEADGSGTVTRQYGWRPDGLWGTDPLYLKTGGQSYYYHNDHLGTPQKLVSVTGQVVWEARYAAFGEAQAAGTIENPLRFPGQYYDAETGMHYNYFRYYEPSIGRYLSADPIDLGGGINLYLYAEANSVNALDPLGLKSKKKNKNKSDPGKKSKKTTFDPEIEDIDSLIDQMNSMAEYICSYSVANEYKKIKEDLIQKVKSTSSCKTGVRAQILLIEKRGRRD